MIARSIIPVERLRKAILVDDREGERTCARSQFQSLATRVWAYMIEVRAGGLAGSVGHTLW